MMRARAPSRSGLAFFPPSDACRRRESSRVESTSSLLLSGSHRGPHAHTPWSDTWPPAGQGHNFAGPAPRAISPQHARIACRTRQVRSGHGPGLGRTHAGPADLKQKLPPHDAPRPSRSKSRVQKSVFAPFSSSSLLFVVGQVSPHSPSVRAPYACLNTQSCFARLAFWRADGAGGMGAPVFWDDSGHKTDKDRTGSLTPPGARAPAWPGLAP